VFVRIKRVLLCATILTGAAVPALASVPSTPAAEALVRAPIDDTNVITVRGELSALVASSKDLGAVDDRLALPHMQLILKRSPARQAALDKLVSDQLKSGTAVFHKWVEPSELFNAFGPAQSDIDKTVAWLTSHGFTVNRVSATGMVIDFSGTARQAQDAFHTEIHNLTRAGNAHIANIREPAIPAALSDVVTGVTLHNFFPKPTMRSIGVAQRDTGTGKWKITKPGPNFVTPQTADGIFQAIGPNDFTLIYNVNQARAGFSGTGGAPLTGIGATVAVIDDSSIHPKDWTTFRTTFGFTSFAGKLSLQNPGNCGNPGFNTNESEADLDAEYASISAPDANVIQASCPDSNTTFGVFTALENMVALGTPAQTISISFGSCEAAEGTTFLEAWNQAAEEGAAEGLSIFVSSGDGGPDTCDNHDSAPFSTSGIGANGLASGPYVTAVGGTDFYDTALGEGSTYFSAKNRPGLVTALSYVPEIAWNDTCASPILRQVRAAKGLTTATTSVGYCNDSDGRNFLGIGAGSGAPSNVYAKPDWQTLNVPGVPNDGVRDLPDVSLFAANGLWGHFYVFCGSDPATGGSPCRVHNGADILGNAAGGTSFASPAFAGIMVLETQLRGELQNARGPVRIGNVAPRLYQIAAAQFSTGTSLALCNSTLGNKISSACVFNNVTANTNDVPCEKGTPNCYTNKLSTVGLGVLSENPGRDEVDAFPATPGYSLATGLGTVNATNLLSTY
jgi:subtilase family serine protease